MTQPMFNPGLIMFAGYHYARLTEDLANPSLLTVWLQAKGLCGECRFNCCQGSCGEWCLEACRASCDCRSPSMTGCLDALCPQRRVSDYLDL